MNSLRMMCPAAALVLLASLAAAQTPETSPETGWTIGLGGGFNVPLGAWTDHPYASGVQQFGRSWTVSAEIAQHTSRRFSLAILGYYARLSTVEWTEYAASRGDRIEASASLGMVLLALRPRVYSDGDNAVTLELAGGVLLGRGEESFGSYHYEYTFLPDVSMVLGGGLEYERRIQRGVAAFVRGFYGVSLANPEYGDGKDVMLGTMPLVIGFRLYF